MSTNEKAGDSSLHISWHDSAWLPILNRENVLKYFSERSNPFYDSSCNNELIKMQGLSFDHLVNMTGVEYSLLHCQEPILYIIRKQTRHSPTQVTSLADYYVIAGVVYQAPDVKSIVNSRLTSTLHHIQSAFTEAVSYSRYHPSKGYWWQFTEDGKEGTENKGKKKTEEPGSIFQCARVDKLLENLTLQFPHKFYQTRPGELPIPVEKNNKSSESINGQPDHQNVNMQVYAAGQQPNASSSASFNIRTAQSPNAVAAAQVRVKVDQADVKPPLEKRTKYM